MEYENIYKLGEKAQNGNEQALLKIIELKKAYIKKFSKRNEDCYQLILERVIKGIKKYKF